MSADLPRRLGSMLLAAALLFGVLVGSGVSPAIAATVSSQIHSAMPMSGQVAMAGSCCDSPSGQPATQPGPQSGRVGHAQPCLLVCGTVVCSTLADANQPVFGPAWFGTVFRHHRPATAVLRGLSHEPPVFPPIAA